MTRYILITGGKGGVAKTTTAVSLGCALNFFGKDVTVVDANLTTPNVGIYLGSPVVPINLHHVLQGKNHISEAVYIHPTGTKIVPASISLDDMKNTKPDRLKHVIRGLKGLTDFVIIDCAAGLGKEALLAIDASDEIIITTNPEMPAIADALKTIRVAEDMGKKILGVVVTRYRNSNDEIPIENIEALLEHKVIAIIPESIEIKESLALRDNVIYTHPTSDASVSYKKLASELCGAPYIDERAPIKPDYFSKILRLFGVR